MEVQAPAERLLLERVEDNRVFVLIVKFVLGVCRHNAARGCDLSSEPPDTLVTIIIIARLPSALSLIQFGFLERFSPEMAGRDDCVYDPIYERDHQRR